MKLIFVIAGLFILSWAVVAYTAELVLITPETNPLAGDGQQEGDLLTCMPNGGTDRFNERERQIFRIIKLPNFSCDQITAIMQNTGNPPGAKYQKRTLLSDAQIEAILQQ